MTLAPTNAGDLSGLEGRLVDDRFRLTSLIDFGGFGAVYVASDEKIPNRRVAVKLGTAVSSERAFTREARLVGQVNHDNIVKVYDYGVEDGMPFIVMELLDGERLDTLAQAHNGRLPPELMVKFADEVGKGLSHAHRHHLIHRDLKPKNVILVDTGSVDDNGQPVKRFIILDFGIAGKIDATDSMANQTMAGAGTPEYMSPEQIAGAESTAATDIYTFGVLLYQLLTGRVPFPLSGASPGAIAQVVTSIVNEPPPSFSLSAPAVTFPPGVEELVMKCLAKEPKDRPESARDVRRDFIAAYAPQSLEGDTDAGASTWTPEQLAEGVRTATGAPHTWKSATRGPAATTMVPLLAVLSVILLVTGIVIARFWGGGGSDTALDLRGPGSLEMAAGTSTPLNLSLTRPSGSETVQLEYEDLPAGVTVKLPEEVDTEFIEGRIVTDLNAAPFAGELVFVATAGEDRAELRQPFKLLAPEVWTPQTPDNVTVSQSGELKRIGQRNFSSMLELRVGQEVIRFRLIDTRSSTRSEPPFYMMENKVWNSLYELFENLAPNSGNRREVLGDNRFTAARLPAFGMNANEAYEFTQWLGGEQVHLPTIVQWWIAAGYFEESKDPDYEVGPFRTLGDPVARRREILEEPRPVGESDIDVSVHGIKDMAVNGSEWTSSHLLNRGEPARFPITEVFQYLYLPGQRYGNERLTFDDAKEFFKADGIFESYEAIDASEDIGFRVIIGPGG